MLSARRSALGLKVALVTMHFVYAGVLFLFDTDLIEETKQSPWYALNIVNVVTGLGCCPLCT